MASMAYEFRQHEKIADVASQFNTTVDTIMKLNNVQPPYPKYIEDLPSDVIENGTIELPYVANGRQTFESYYNTAAETIGVEYENVENLNETLLLNASDRYLSAKNFGGSGTDVRPTGRSVIDCFLHIHNGVGETILFPCYPESVGDQNQASYSAVNILGRSEPFQYYTGSGPRTISVKFQMHVDMDSVDDIYQIASAVESCCYPNYGSGISAIKVTFQVGNSVRITGIITSVSTDYSGPILDMDPNSQNAGAMHDPKYAVIDLSFSITEVTGNPPSHAEIFSKGGRR